MPVWTALGTKSRTRVASVRSGSAARPAPASPPPSSSPPHALSAKAATASARRAGALELPGGLGGIVDREPGDPHGDPLPLERDSLRFEQVALAGALGQRPVGSHDALPWNVRVVSRRHHRAREARRLGAQVAVRGHEAGRDRAGASQDITSSGRVGHAPQYSTVPWSRCTAWAARWSSLAAGGGDEARLGHDLLDRLEALPGDRDRDRPHPP